MTQQSSSWKTTVERYCQTKLKHFSLCFMYLGVLISLIVHEAWAIRFSVAKMLPRPDHMAAAA